ncbi:hypothetical protein I305_06472 [Cryptococcus gattii E566]|uniref:Uncharacterized protein n=2 Tax=Cryptococcus gattii TaxID=37769 RepID=E6RD12_CRYGW|nr:Hypothetical Protein CGB_J2525C [Cryptococcus gattii WM276]ADV24720.1 Hypothetical Protein CGB_J2525C [Cryptococcus gattii WM276]KIR80143.1 hypothetical protein I306_02816 [Cryptococcus gattii EJB2]KIY31015.1 hypothetical protein I305_06472 [Cryptococcus gattii E566]KJD99583.1 hypothetical protein I311_06838 [Cryptococcus gattii NT-10]
MEITKIKYIFGFGTVETPFPPVRAPRGGTLTDTWTFEVYGIWPSGGVGEGDLEGGRDLGKDG